MHLLFSDAQAQAWQGYYQALKNPPVIATITQSDGSVLSINSQVPPPAPMIRQHKNQYIEPVAGVLKTGVGWYFGHKIVEGVIDGMGDTHITNGSGTVTYDRSEPVQVETNHAEDGSTLSQGSNNDSSDNSDHHVEKADPTVVTQDRAVIVDPVVVNPEVVNPGVVVVQPSYPPAE